MPCSQTIPFTAKFHVTNYTLKSVGNYMNDYVYKYTCHSKSILNHMLTDTAFYNKHNLNDTSTNYTFLNSCSTASTSLSLKCLRKKTLSFSQTGLSVSTGHEFCGSAGQVFCDEARFGESEGFTTDFLITSVILQLSSTP